MKKLLRLAMIALMLTGTAALAQQTGDSVSYTFSGHLVGVTQCTINSGNPVEVHFGKVGIAKIDAGGYVQDIRYTLDCGSVSGNNTVTLMIMATPALWDTQAMTSSVEGLGVHILIDDRPVELNTEIKIDDPAAPPKLRAQLLKDPAVILTGQPFTVAGTMVVEYI